MWNAFKSVHGRGSARYTASKSLQRSIRPLVGLGGEHILTPAPFPSTPIRRHDFGTV